MIMGALIEGLCDLCEGKGERPSGYGYADQCEKCDGLGIILTPLGQEVESIAWRQVRAIRRAKEIEEDKNL